MTEFGFARARESSRFYVPHPCWNTLQVDSLLHKMDSSKNIISGPVTDKIPNNIWRSISKIA